MKDILLHLNFKNFFRCYFVWINLQSNRISFGSKKRSCCI